MNTNTKILIVAVAVIAVASISIAILVTGGEDYHYEKGDNGKALDMPCEPYTVTDLAGQTFTFDHYLGAVAVQYTLSGGPFLTMAALLGEDVTDFMVGVDSRPARDRAFMWDEFVKSYPALGELESIGDIGKDWDTAKVLLKKPSALIAPYNIKGNIDKNGVTEAFEKAGIPIIYIYYQAEDVEDFEKSIKLLGKLFNKEKRAKELADYYAAKIRNVTDKVDTLLKTHERRQIYMECCSSDPATIGNTWNNTTQGGAILYKCGGNTYDDSTSYPRLQSEFILDKNPTDIVFFGYDSSWNLGYGKTADDVKGWVDSLIKSRPGWDKLSTYKDKEIYAASLYLTRDIFDFPTFEFVAQIVWDDTGVFDDLDPEKDLVDFFDKWVPFLDISGCWFYQYGDVA